MAISMMTSAQTKVDGVATVGGGLGSAAPYQAGVSLGIKTPKLTLKPYIGITGVSKTSSAMKEDARYFYPGTGNYNYLDAENRVKGLNLAYGLDMLYDINRRNHLSVMVSGNHQALDGDGYRNEGMLAPNGTVISGLRSALRIPARNEEKLDASATYVFDTNRKGESLSLKYAYSLTVNDDEQEQIVNEGINVATNNHVKSHANVQQHQVLGEWKRPLAAGHMLNIGASYTDRITDSDDKQWFGIDALDEQFHHRYQTVGAIAGYMAKIGPLSANVRVEYDYTNMQNKNYNDLLPSLRLQWNVGNGNTLTALYGKRLIRPTLSYLNPAHIRGYYETSYGNENLVGMHVENVMLTFQHKTKKVDFSTSLNHIFVQDAFNALWLLKNGVREYTWGNEGVRRAWSLTPELVWKASPKTQVNAKANVIWDKRIAYAINMAKEHWGVTLRAGVDQQLPLGLSLKLHAQYSEGNTIDLYSHESRSYELGGQLKRSFLKNNRLTAIVDYTYRDYAHPVVTQVPFNTYECCTYMRPATRNAASLTLLYQF